MYQPKGLQTTEKVVVPKNKRGQVLHDHHDAVISGHPGAERTTELVRRSYWWRGMGQTIAHYVRTCPTCQVMKSENAKQKGLLSPLPIPAFKWEQVTTDLVTDLPESNGYTAVAVFVDRMTKYCKFAPCTKEVSAKDYAGLYFRYVFPQAGLPEVIISDRDPRFTSAFWTELFRLVGTKLRMSTAYHPQTDGQSEVTIRTLENFLRPYLEDRPEGWSELLSTVEFAANNAVNASTGHTPFYLMNGQHPRGLDLVPRDGTKVLAAEEMLTQMELDLEEAKRRYKHAQEQMCRAANKRRRHVEFQVGDEVSLRCKHLSLAFTKHIPGKIRRRYLGPFKIVEKVSPLAYRLGLPVSWKVHPTVHVSKLRAYHRSKEFERDTIPGPAAMDPETGQPEYEVESIVRTAIKEGERKWLVVWKGYPIHEATWEPRASLKNAQEALRDFERRTSAKLRARPRGASVVS